MLQRIVLTLVFISVTVFVYSSALPTLDRPISIESAVFADDEGSTRVSIRDGNGRQFDFAMISAGEPDKENSLRYVKYLFGVPIPFWPRRGGENERKFARFLNRTFATFERPSFKTVYAEEGEAGVNQYAGEVRIVYAVYSALEKRATR